MKINNINNIPLHQEPKIQINRNASEHHYNIWRNISQMNNYENSSNIEENKNPSEEISSKEKSQVNETTKNINQTDSIKSDSYSLPKNEEAEKAIDNLNELKNYDIFSMARHNKYDELETLFIEGLNPDSKDEYGNTLLIIAAQNDNKRIVKLALRYGAQINMPNSMGNTALHFAIEYNYKNVYEYLIKKGADPELKNLRGIKARNGIRKGTKERNLFLGDNLLNNNKNSHYIINKIV